MKTQTKLPTRSMCALRSRTINRFKASPKKSSGKASPTPSGKTSPARSLTFTPVAALPGSKPWTPQRYVNKATGTTMIVKKPQFKHLSFYRALLRSMSETKLRTGSTIKRDPAVFNQVSDLVC